MYRRILPAAVAMLLLGATPSVAQVNIEAFRGKAGLSGAARFSMSSDFGNVDVVRFDGAGNITLTTGAITKRNAGSTYASQDQIVMALIPTTSSATTPSMAPVGIAAFMGLMALAGGYRLRRKQNRH